MTDAKLREFHRYFYENGGVEDYDEPPQYPVATTIDRIHFREVSPALDAAVKQMVEALEWEEHRCGRLHGPLFKALDAYRRATEVGK